MESTKIPIEIVGYDTTVGLKYKSICPKCKGNLFFSERCDWAFCDCPIKWTMEIFEIRNYGETISYAIPEIKEDLE